MSLLKRNSPRKTRARKETTTERVGETKSPTLGPVVEKVSTQNTDQQQEMLDRYAYKPESPASEPVQINQSLSSLSETPAPTSVKIPEVPTKAISFGLLDLSFFCEERIYNVMYLPIDAKARKVQELALVAIKARLEVYSEYTQEVKIGAFKDTLHFYRGEILIPEEFLTVTGFMRKFLGVEKVHVLFETGEILSRETNWCNFWLDRAPKFFEPKNIPLDKPNILDEDVCFDCNLSCLFRHRQQMIN